MDKTATYNLRVTDVLYQRWEILWNPLLIFDQSCWKCLVWSKDKLLYRRLSVLLSAIKLALMNVLWWNVFWFCSYSTDYLNTNDVQYRETHSLEPFCILLQHYHGVNPLICASTVTWVIFCSGMRPGCSVGAYTKTYLAKGCMKITMKTMLISCCMYGTLAILVLLFF